ncbi:hydroxymethylglutaryl-CoA reductase [Luteibacter yeojuensis]
MAAGKRSLHDVPAGLPVDVVAAGRRWALTKRSGVGLSGVGDYSADFSTAKCENLIGAVQIPLGVVGPLCLQGAHVGPREEIFVALATTEGALIASTARGCRAVREAGGAIVHAEDVGMTRAPVFRTSGIQQTRRLLDWVADHYQDIRAFCEETSTHLRLLDISPQCVGSTVFLRFRFTCGDAMGMNMATIACDRVVNEWIVPQTGVPCVSVSGNYCVDKKPAALNFIEGRGKRIFAEVVLSRDVLATCLKTEAAALCEVQYRKNLLGSIMAGSLGFNSHYANIVAAFFMATGQDVAQVVEGALGVTCIEPRGDGDVYASVFLPDVPLAATGGGTTVGTQRESLDLLGVHADPLQPGAAALRLAEILGAVVLAGELSTLAALSAHHLAGAHERLGRPVKSMDPARA